MEKTFELYKKLAEQGDSNVQYKLGIGRIYYKNRNIDNNRK